LARVGPAPDGAFRRHFRVEFAVLLTMMHPMRLGYASSSERLHHASRADARLVIASTAWWIPSTQFTKAVRVAG
jgi:hypothetical protein